MPIVQFTRFKTDKPEEMIKIVRQAKKIFEKRAGPANSDSSLSGFSA
ncbi:hypothetical protein ABIF68_008499 [Bradyrhizobium japonicum]|jgi:hypothetical protein